MKSAFLLMRYYLDQDQDFLKYKFDEQIKAFKNMGYSVVYLGIGSDGVYLIEGEKKQKLRSLHFSRIPGLSRIFLYRALYQSAADIAKYRTFDLSYIRNLPTPSFVNALKALKKSCKKMIVEIPTYPADSEFKSDKRFWRKPLYAMMKRHDRRAAQYVDLYTLIGEQADSYLERSAINIINGTSVGKYPPHKPRDPDGEIHILALASMARWHGYDRLIQGLYEYMANGGAERVYIHLVGPDGDGSLAQWKKLTQDLNLTEHVRFEGPMYGERLDHMFDSCDVACDSLAAYTKGLSFGICLKVAEYCSRGIPVTCTKDLNDTKYPIPFCLGGIPNDPSPIDIGEVAAFVRRTQLEKNVAEKMREYAEGLSWEAQFTKVLDYFKQAEERNDNDDFSLSNR